ncbi:GGDEF domain-containing protein [Pandoraea capi]|uniref:diguanylate cyclase n=1 Tax=Pandoraea capi TaxID=2508286 RepID=A0ABY6VNG9_9BURK|nr:diguanylate cyclase [Pandoraea capi]VVD68775.1 GGDEF domain-containing protein [Pandoraea capi]
MESRFEKGLGFSRRVLALRSIGCALSALLVFVTVFPLRGAPIVIVLLAVNAFVWPTVAHMLAVRAIDPIEVEHRNLLCDSLFGGAWVAAMHFADAPSAVLISMLLMHNAAVGGYRLMFRCGAAMLLGSVLVGCLTGFKIALGTEVRQVAACFPMLMFYPAAVGLSSHKLAQQLSQSKRAIREMSGQDELTRLKNRHLWMKLFTESFERNRRASLGSACVAIIDIDEFKRVNDTYGHLRGDSLLRLLGVILGKHQSTYVSAGRYGGDEFCVLLDEQRLSSACQMLEEIRGEFLREACWDWDASPVTVSIGVAELRTEFKTPSDWLAAADAALYVAKRSGKNSVITWAPSLSQVASSHELMSSTEC